MKKLLKLCAVFCTFTILLTSMVGCRKAPVQDIPPGPMDIAPTADEKAVAESYKADAFFGKTDEELLKAKGSEGQKGTVDIDGKEYLLCRIYRELFFGIDSEVTYMYDKDVINKISVGMRDTQPQAAIDALVEKLGDTDQVSQNGDNYVLKATWTLKDLTYQMIYDGMVVTVVMEPTAK